MTRPLRLEFPNVLYHVTEMQKRIGREKDDLNIPQQQKWPIAKPLSEIAARHKDRDAAIIAAYKTGAYSQREIGEFYQLHPTTIGVIVRLLDLAPFCISFRRSALICLNFQRNEPLRTIHGSSEINPAWFLRFFHKNPLQVRVFFLPT